MNPSQNTKKITDEISLDQYLRLTLTKYIIIFFLISTFGSALFYAYQLRFTVDQSLNESIQNLERYIYEITTAIDLKDDKAISDLIDNLNKKYPFNVSLNSTKKEDLLFSYFLNKYEIFWSFSSQKVFAYRKLDTSFSENTLVFRQIFSLFDNFSRPLIMIFFTFLIFNIIAYLFLYSNLKLNIFNSITHIHSSLIQRNYSLPNPSTNRNILKEFMDLAKAVSNYRDLASLKLKMKLSQDYAHEIKGPVNIILNNLMRIRNLKSVEKKNQLLNNTIQKAEGVISDIANVLNKFKSQGHYDIEYGYFELFKIFPKEALVNSKLRVYGDKILLKFLVTNLFSNALDAASSPEKINITINQKKNNLQLSISNDGAANILDCDSIFERGYTTKKNGNGIGLDLSKTIVELHNGSISARKLNSNEIEFNVELPL